MKTTLNKISLMLFVALLLTSVTVFAHEDSKTIKINAPTVQCGMCKKTIEKYMKNIDGVLSTNVDYKKKVITVKYNPEEITPDEIRKAISDSGYQADDVKANKKAYNKLPSCCKVPGKK